MIGVLEVATFALRKPESSQREDHYRRLLFTFRLAQWI